MLNFWKNSVQDEIEKNEKLRLEDINNIQEWIIKQPHLPEISKNQIILFMHASGYRIQETKILIENYYNLRTKYSQFFSSRDPSHSYIQQTMDVTGCIIHGTDNFGRRILWTKLLNCEDPRMYYPTTAIKTMFMITDIDHLETGTVPGYTMVLDGKGFSIQHSMRCSFSNARSIISYVQTASTVVIGKVFILNMTPAAEKIMSILRPFIRSELFNKITICPEGNYDQLNKIIAKDVIPRDYNGESPFISELNAILKKKLQSYAEFFAEEEKQRIKEEMRLNESSANNDNTFGIDGSFKTLAID